MTPWEQAQVDARSRLSREQGAHDIELSWMENASPRLVMYGRGMVLFSQLALVASIVALIAASYGGLHETWWVLFSLVLAHSVTAAVLGGALWGLGGRKRRRSLRIDAAGLRRDDGTSLSWDRVHATSIEDAFPNARSEIGIPVWFGQQDQVVEGKMRFQMGPGPHRWAVEAVDDGTSWPIAQGVLEVEARAISEVIVASRPAELAPADVAAEQALRGMLRRDGDCP